MSHAEEPPSGLVPTAVDADRWQEAAQLRAQFRGWIVIWLASEGEFRAYRRLPRAHRDTVLRAPTVQDMAARIEQAQVHALLRIPQQAGEAGDS